MGDTAAQVPIWVAAVVALATSLVMPAINSMREWWKARAEKDIEFKKLEISGETKLMDYLQEELKRSRTDVNECEAKYALAMEHITRLEARCARLEAIMMHLHPEIAVELMKK